MKATKQRKRKIAEFPQEKAVIVDCNGVNKSSKRAPGRRESITEKNVHTLARDDPGVMPFSAVQGVGQQLSVVDALYQATNQAKKVEPEVGLPPLGKIKLQLFPIDEDTRKGLEKVSFSTNFFYTRGRSVGIKSIEFIWNSPYDHNPYLELTLRPRKKISSVLKHLNNKWGSSAVATGEVMLFPYNIRLEKLNTYKRWSIHDNHSCAADVYDDIERPSLFRLRYGWFSDFDSLIMRVPLKTILSGPSFDLQGLHKNGCRIAVLDDGDCKLGETSNVFRPSDTSESVDAGLEQITFVNAATGQMDAEYKNIGLIYSGGTSGDSLTNSSIGWLLSDGSLFGKIDNCDSKCKGMKSISQPIQVLSSDISIGGLLSEASMRSRTIDDKENSDGSKHKLQLNRDTSIIPSSDPWEDSFTALSIGGLLSEASLQAKIDCGKKAELQPTQLISDSLDAFISENIRSQTQLSRPSTHSSHSSILDAEDTCHAFSFRKSSLSAFKWNF